MMALSIALLILIQRTSKLFPKDLYQKKEMRLMIFQNLILTSSINLDFNMMKKN